VFDDITHLAQAQRDAAWGEVARRLAHEIKNPLTPIQLSAERLQHKLLLKLPDSDADVLKRATGTIVNQVTALKGMVDDFSQYARASRMTSEQVSLNDLVREVLVLYESMGVPIEPHLAENLPRVAADPALLRQVLHNLIQNAIDALAGTEKPRIVVTSTLEDNGIGLSVRDNGAGIAETVIGRIFEPYVTTKPKGTGLGMAIVKKIIDEHHGHILVENLKPHGAHVSILLPLRAAA
jgi:nitrogen fixation/metabolism regulation signal transduction histidine kinase